MMDAFKDVEKALNKTPEPSCLGSFSEISESATPTKPEEDEALADDDLDYDNPPDGGLTAWLQVILNILVNCLSWGYPSAYGVFQLYYVETMQLPLVQTSWVGSVQTFLCFVICAPSGRLADAGYSRETTVAGSVLLVLGTFMTSLCTRYWQIFLAQGVCTGIGLGLIYMPAVAVMMSYFKRKRAIVIGLGGMGASLGSSVFPALVQYLIPAIGFRWAVRCLALLFAFICLLSVLFIKPRLAPRKSGPLFEWRAFLEVTYTLYTLGTCLIFWALFFTSFYIQLYATTFLGFDSTNSVELPIILAAVGIPARLGAGLVTDKFVGPMNMYIVSTMLLGVIGFTWIGVTTQEGMYAFVVCYGLANGCAQASFGSSLASLTEDPRKMGTRYGMVCTFLAFATLAGPPTAGSITDRYGGDYKWAQVWAGAVTVLGAATIMIGRWWKTGLKMAVKF